MNTYPDTWQHKLYMWALFLSVMATLIYVVWKFPDTPAERNVKIEQRQP